MTPKPPAGGTPLAKNKACDDAKADDKAPEREHTKAPTQTQNEAPAPPAASLLSPSSHVVMPTSITVAPWGRLLDGELFAQSRRIDWHLLLRPTFGADSLQCPNCQGRLTILATVTDRGAVTKTLTLLGRPTAPPPRAAARDPTDEQMTFDFDAA